MLIQYFSIGHCQASWDARQNQNILKIFSFFWKCKQEELLVSFDGLSLHLPPEITKRGWGGKSWYHTDQSPHRNDFECLQSFLTLLDINEGDATLTFLEGSNKYHHLLPKSKDNKTDWYKLSEVEEKVFIEKGCEYKKIKAPKGSLIFWDSRTIHCGCEPLKTREVPNFRAIIYVSYSPRSFCSKGNLNKKKKAFDELRTTNHWAHKPKLFSKNPRTYGGEIPTIKNIDKPNVGEIGLKLAGF